MKQVLSKSEVAHFWAHQKQDTGRVMNKHDQALIISELEKIKQALTEAQKNIEDNDLKQASANIFIAKAKIWPIDHKVTKLFEQQ
jgi:hypothetical protein